MTRPLRQGNAKAGKSQGADRQSGAERAAYFAIIEQYKNQQYEQALTLADELLQSSPRFGNGWNLKGVLLNNLGRPREAIVALENAVRFGAGEAAYPNLAKSWLTLGDTEKSSEMARQAIRLDPKNIEASIALARARLRGGDPAGALKALQPALLSHPKSGPLRELRANVLNDLGRYEEALNDYDIALAATPGLRIRLNRARLLVRVGRTDDGLAELEKALADYPTDEMALRAMADFHFNQRGDRETANGFYRRALEARFDVDTAASFVFSLSTTRGAHEAANVAEAHAFAARCVDDGFVVPANSSNFVSVLSHVADFTRLSRIDRWASAEIWARSNSPGGLHGLLSRVETDEDRKRLLELHRAWGDNQVRRAASGAPMPAIVRRRPGGKIRIGIMSSDLRHHPVTYFALPLFDHYDPERFELYCYSFYPNEPDPVQRHVMSKATEFRTLVGIGDRDIARQMIADELDIVFELGGATHMNRIGVLAYRVAPIQASWLGYPNSIGLPTIDRILVDPYIRSRDDLLIEQPFLMPKSWVSLSQVGFHDGHEITGDPPMLRNGYLTFGTANNPMKYTPALIALWSRVLAEVPNSRFLFIRPEGDVPAFRAHLLEHFAAGGISADRILFRPVRGKHMPHYNEIDISLDCAPHTGGTTTCEAMWMGVPVVTRIGPAFYERLSYSNLSNAGLGDLCAEDDDGYVRAAVTLAGDTRRLVDLRRSLREQIKRSPLGDGRAWVRDWQDEIARLVNGGAA